MKKLLLFMLVITAAVCLVACGNQEKTQPVSNNETEKVEENSEPATLPASQSDDMYQAVIDDYKFGLASFNLDDVDAEEKLVEEHGYANPSLVTHIARYEADGVEVTFAFYDIDKNGVDELLVGASGTLGAIYAYDKDYNVPVNIFFQDTMERGMLNIYDNGIICSEGSGGAALHYYEFGKMAANGVSYELLESIEEEYIYENEAPVYRDAKTGTTLEYKSLDEIMDKYVSGAKIVEL